MDLFLLLDSFEFCILSCSKKETQGNLNQHLLEMNQTQPPIVHLAGDRPLSHRPLVTEAEGGGAQLVLLQTSPTHPPWWEKQTGSTWPI